MEFSGRRPEDVAHTLRELDQTAADRDQSVADRDHTGSDRDQTDFEGDQAAADRDQPSADSDQDRSDHLGEFGTDPAGYDRTRQARNETARARDVSAGRREETASARDRTAFARDLTGADRDRAAAARDALADARDAEIEDLERFRGQDGGRIRTGGDTDLRAARDRQRAGEDRRCAAVRRGESARDRELAAGDREQAAADRAHAAREAAIASVDELTLTLRRGVGLAAMQREVDRAQRSGEPLVVAYIDVDGLKAINDHAGHPAGDETLRRLAEVIREHLRPYDLIVRLGGDEFLCGLSNAESGEIEQRLQAVSTTLWAEPAGCSMTFGIAELRAGDSLEELIERADADLLSARHRPARRDDSVGEPGEGDPTGTRPRGRRPASKGLSRNPILVPSSR
jgi:diguanylate cyclase (GGDEF)-like protein